MRATAFVDIKQAFDKVCQQELLFKIKTIMPNQFYLTLKSYLSNRDLDNKLNNEDHNYLLIRVPPYLYFIYRSDSSRTNSYFTDDTMIIALDDKPLEAVEKLETYSLPLLKYLSKEYTCVGETVTTNVYIIRNSKNILIFSI